MVKSPGVPAKPMMPQTVRPKSMDRPGFLGGWAGPQGGGPLAVVRTASIARSLARSNTNPRPTLRRAESPRRVRRLGLLLTGLGETGVLTAVGLLEFCRRLMRFAPISNEMALNQIGVIGQHVLGLPKSY
jgi:hypothetical protein